MKQRELGNRVLRCISVVILSLFCLNSQADNESTPNLDFKSGNFNNWERYYGYFGPINFMDFNSPNIYTNDYTSTTVPDETKWTLKTDSKKECTRGGSSNCVEVHGTFGIVNSQGRDENMTNCSKALQRLPEGFSNAAIIGSKDDDCILYNYNSPVLWQKRAAAERLVYRFIVDERSTLLTLCFASVLFEPRNERAAHFGDEHPGMCLNVKTHRGEDYRVLPCAEYCGDASSNDPTLVNLKNTDCNFTSSSSNNVTYKPWTTNIYDLREFIGYEIEIEAYVHDCLLELYVCNNCNTCYPYTSGITDHGNGKITINQCSYCRQWNAQATKRIMAGGHWAYGYLTGKTQELKMDVDNCPDDPMVKLTVPEGFGEGHYTWKTSDGVTLVDGSQKPYTNNVAYVRRSEIQDVDYICTIKGNNDQCAEISISTRIAKEPIVMDFVASNACYNNVTFTDRTHITEVLQDGEMIEPDTIVKWTWEYDDHKGHNGTLSSYTRQQALANPEIMNPQGTFEWTSENTGKYDMTLTVQTAKGCEKSLTVPFKVQPKPTLQMSGALDICKGEVSTLQVTNYNDPNNTYVWKRYKNNKWITLGESANSTYDIAGLADSVGKYSVEIYREEDLTEGNVVIGSTECHYEKEFEVTVKEIPNFDFIGYALDNGRKKVEICKNQSTALSIQDKTPALNAEHTWSNTEKGLSVEVGPTDTTKYIVTANSGCRYTDSIWVYVKPLPKLNIEGPTAICVGEEGTLTASGLTDNTKYTWKSESTTVATGTNTITVKKDVSGYYYYTLEGISPLGCPNTYEHQVTVRDTPNVTIPAVSPICEGEKVVINVYNADSCSWNGGELKAVPSQSSISEVPTQNPYQLKAYIYYNDVTCASNYNVPITINKKPEIKIEGDTFACKGSSVTLEAKDTADYTGYPNAATKTMTYKWNDVHATASAVLTTTPPAMSSYTVTINNGSCSSSEDVVVNIYEKPEFTVEPLYPKVCKGDMDTIIAESWLKTFRWYIIENGMEKELTPSADMPKGQLDMVINNDVTIYCEAWDEHGCSNIRSTQVIVKPSPVIGYVGTTQICEGSQITLSPKGADQNTYSWERTYKGGTAEKLTMDGDALQDAPEGYGTARVTYTVYGYKDGCIGSLDIPVNIDAQPIVTISGPDGICKGTTATLTASSEAAIKSWSWTGLNKSTETITVAPITDQTYYIVGYATSGCPGNAKFTVKVNEIPNITISGGDPICSGEEAVLTATGAATYSWTASPSTTLSYEGAGNATVKGNLNEVTLFSVAGFSEENCPGYKTKSVLVYPYPELTTSAKDICQGDVVDISVDGAASYEWRSEAGTKETAGGIQVGTGTRFTDSNVPATATSYTVYVRGTENNCTTEKEVTFSINLLPEITISGNHVYCQGEMIDLTAANGVSYQWSNGSTGANMQTIANGSISKLSVVGTDANNCSNSADYDIIVKELPHVTIKNPSSTNICVGNDVVLEGQGATEYQWYKTEQTDAHRYTGDATCVGGDCAIIQPTINETDKYIVEGKEIHTQSFDGISETATCSSSAEITITARPKPVVEISGTLQICKNTSTNLTAANTEPDAIIAAWAWTSEDVDLDNDKSYINTGNLTSSKKFKAIATSNYNCQGYDEKEVQLFPTYNIAINGADYVCENKTVQLTAVVTDENGMDKSADMARYSWSPQGGTNQATTEMSLAGTTEFNLTATDINGCQSDATPKSVEWISLPKITIEQEPEDGVCAGDNSVTLKAISNKGNENMKPTSWEWLTGGNGIVYDHNNQVVNTESFTLNNLTGTSTYKVKGTDKYGCVSEQEVHVVEVNDAPDLTITGVTQACKGNTIELTVSSSRNADIYWTDTECGNAGHTLSDGIRNVTLSEVRDYVFTASITDNGCTTIKKHTIKVNDIPSVTVATTNGKDYVCQGNSITLKATATVTSGTPSYSWNVSSSATNEATITPTSSPTSCLVTITDENNCTATANMDIIIRNNPILYINNETNGDTSICENSSVILEASGLDNNQYTWKKDGAGITGTTSIEPTITSKSIFSIEGNDSYGCPGSAKYTVNTKGYPVFTVVDAESCEGTINTVKVKGDADYYTWTWTTEGGEAKSATGSNYSEILTTSRTYSVTGTKDGCTSAPQTVEAVVNKKPAITITSLNNPGESPIEMCFKENDQLTASGEAVTYAWSTGNGLTSTGNVATIEPTAVGSHTYTVKGTDAKGCVNEYKMDVTVHALPNVTLNGDKSICNGAEATITASGATSYQWTVGDNDVTQTDNTKYTGKLTKTTTFAVVGTANGCTSLPTNYTVEVKDLLNLSWATPVVCENGDVTVTVNGATSIQWEDGTNTGSSRTLYNVTDSDKDGKAEYKIKAWYNGCSKDTVVVISVNPLPTITFDASRAGKATGVANQSQICLNDELTLVANSDLTADFSWNTNDTEAEITKKPSTSGTIKYTVTATDKTNGCKSSNSFVVIVNNNPTIKINDEVNGSAAICVDNTYELKATGAETYVWEVSNDGGVSYTNMTPSSNDTYSLTIAKDQTFKVTGTNDKECSASAIFAITANEKPNISFEYTPSCAGINNTISLVNRTANTQYAWSWADKANPTVEVGNIANATSLTQALTSNRIYTVKATSQEGCTVTETKEVTVHPRPSFTVSNDASICYLESAELKATNANLYNLSWKDKSGNAYTASNGTITVEPRSTTIYTATAEDKTTGCTQSYDVKVTVNPLPSPQIVQTGAACIGNTITLSANGGDTYEWFNKNESTAFSTEDAVSYTITEEMSNPFVITLKARNNTGCEKSLDYTIVKIEKPVIAALGDMVRCNGDAAGTIRLSGASRYTWTSEDDFVGSSFTEQLTANKTYSIHAESGSCYTDTTISVVVNELPTVVIKDKEGHTDETSICLYDEAQLSVTTNAADHTYIWNTQSDQEQINVTANTLATQTYSVTATDNKTNCKNKAQFNVRVKALPAVEINSEESAYCLNETATLSANTTYKSYEWRYIDDKGDTTAVVNTTQQYQPVIDRNTTYILTAVDATTGCKNTNSKLISAKNRPTIGVTAPNVCFNKQASITVDKTKSKADYYIWPDNTTSNSSWLSEDPITKKSNFKITASLDNCEKDSIISIDVNALPEITLTDAKGNVLTDGGSFAVCSNDNLISITANDLATNTPSANFSWSNGTTGELLTASPSNQTTYKVTATNANGCVSSASQTIQINVPMPITISGDNIVCENESITLTAAGASNCTWNITPTPDPADLEYDPAHADNSVLSIKNCKENMTITVSGTDGNACQSSSSDFTVTVVKNPILTVTPAETDRKVCVGSALKLSATAGANVSIQWGGEAEGLLDYTFKPTAAEVGVHTLTVEGKTTQGCRSTTSVDVTVNPLPTFTITGDDICQNNSTELMATGTDMASFQWTGYAANINPIKATRAGTYTVTGTDNNGCSATSSFVVEAIANPSVTIARNNISWVDDKTACQNSTIELEANGINNYTYRWTTKKADGSDVELTASGSNGTIVNPTITKDSTFTVTAYETHTTSHGGTLTCHSSASYDVILAPNPNFELTADKVCAGDNSRVKVINGTSGTTYEWAWEGGSQHGGNYHDEVLSENRDYIVTGTLGHCSKTSDVYTAVVYPLPTIASINMQPNTTDICLGEQLTLTASASSSNGEITAWSWSANKDGSSITTQIDGSALVKPSQTGERTYTVKIEDAKGCKATKDQDIFVNGLPNIEVIGARSVCPNGNIALQVAGDLEFNWYYYDNDNKEKGSLIMTGNGSDVFTQSIANDTTFYVEVKDANTHCSKGQTVDVTVKALPALSFIGESNICLGSSTEITLLGNSGGKSYWQKSDGSYPTTSATSLRMSPKQVGDTTYNVRVETSNNCIIDTSVTLHVKALPTVTINGEKKGSSDICFKSEATLTANDGLTYVWNNRSTEKEIRTTPLTITNYYVVGTDATTQCSDTAWHTVNVRPLPSIAIVAEEKVCEDSTATLTVDNALYNAAYSYQWGTGETTQSITATIAQGTNSFEVTCTDNTANHCQNKAVFEIVSKPNPTITITGNEQVCQNDYLRITASSDLASSTYSWSENGKEISTLSSINEKIDKERTFTISVTKDGCTTTLPVMTSYYELPAVTADITNDKLDDNIICYNTSAELTATVTGGAAPYTYAWTSNYIEESGKNISNPTTLALTNTNSSYAFVVKATDAHGCSNKDTVDVTVKNNPTILITGDKAACQGKEASLTASGAGDGGHYRWEDGAETEQITATITKDSTFTVEGWDAYGCHGTSKGYTVTMKNNPTLYFSGARTICLHDTTVINVSGAGASASNYKWYYDSDDSKVTEDSPLFRTSRTFAPTADATYKVIGTMNGCSSDSTISIKVNPLPTIQINGTNNGSQTICQGSNILLSATDDADYNYNWSNNTNTQQITVTPSVSTEYNVEVTDGNGCRNNDTFNVVVVNNPVVTLEADAAVCLDSAVTIRAKSEEGYPTPDNYTWNSGAKSTSDVYTQTISNNTNTFTVITEHSEQGITCTSTATIDVEGKENPNIAMTTESDICEGSAVTIKANDTNVADYYLWPDAAENGMTVWTESESQPTGTHTYEVTGIKRYVSGGKVLSCKQTVPLTVNVHANPQLTVEGPSFICIDKDTVLTVKETSGMALDASDYVWSTGETGTSIRVASSSETATYTVTATNSHEAPFTCSTTVPFTLYGRDNPSFNVTGELSYCEGSTANLTIAGGKDLKSIIWTDQDGTVLGTTSTITPTITKDLTILIKAVNNDDCEAERTIEVKMKPNPIITPQTSDYVCVGSQAKIVVTGANTWKWSHNNSISASITETITKDTTFTVTGTTNGCPTQKKIDIKVWPLPTIDIDASNPITVNADGLKQTEICYKDDITLTAKNGASYNWENVSDGNQASITKSPVEKTTFVVEGKDANGCVNKDTIVVKVNTLPTFTVPASTKVCDNEAASIVASDKSLAYNWGGTDFSGNYQHTTPVVTDTVTYWVTAKDANNCESEKVEYTLVWKPNPDMVIDAIDNVCYNASTTLTVKDNADSQSNYQTTFIWQNDATRQGSTFTTDNITDRTTFTVQGTKEECTATVTKDIDIYNLPNILINNGDEEAEVCSQGSVTLNAFNGVSYKWDGKPAETNSTYTIKPTANGEIHTLWGKDEHECENTDDIRIKIKSLPKFGVSGIQKECVDSTVVLTATPLSATHTYRYVWKDKNGNEIGTPVGANQMKLVVTQDTTVYVTAYDNSTLDCDSTVTFDIKAKNNPTIHIIKEDLNICKGSIATIVVGGDADTYYWLNESKVKVSGNYTLSQVVKKSQEIFTVYAEKEGCTSSQDFTITGLDLPVVEMESQVICYNDSAILTTNPGLVSYRWENTTTKTTIAAASTENFIKQSPKVTSTYQVIGTNDLGCRDTATAVITVNSLPEFKLSSAKTVCEGSVTTVSASNETLSYSWEDGKDGTYEAIASHDYTIGEYPNNYKYTVWAKDANGCMKSDSVTIATKATPTLLITYQDSICSGKTSTMSGVNTSVTYVWRDQLGDTLSVYSSYTTEALNDNMIINVTGTANGCTKDSVLNIGIWQLPDIHIQDAPSVAICKNNSIELKVQDPTPGWSYKWNNNTYHTDDVSYLIYPTRDTYYYLTGKDNHGCENKDTILVELRDRPSFKIEGVKAICINNEAELNGDNASLNYIWYNRNNEEMGRTNGTEKFRITVSQDTALTVVGYTADELKCEVTMTHSIIANPYPVISTARAVEKACYNTQAYIEVKTDIDATYLWDSNETERYIQKIITKDSEFKVTATSTAGCASDTTYKVAMLPLPILQATDTTICYGDTAKLIASSEQENITFRWANAASNGAEFITPTLTSQTKYVVRGTDADGCVGEKTATVSINALPSFTLKSNSPVCRGSEVTITADKEDFSYVWEDDKEGSYGNGNTHTVAIGQDTSFIVWTKDVNQCRSKKTIKVTVKEYPILTMRMDTNYVCYNESRTIYITGANNGYLWNDGSTSNYLTLSNVTKDTLVHVEGTNNGCTSSMDTLIHVWQLPNIAIDPVEAICLNQSTQLNATGGVSGLYKWSTGKTTDQITVLPAKSGITSYNVSGIDENGCKNYDTIDVVVNALPVVSIDAEEFVCRGTDATLTANASTAIAYEWHDADNNPISGETGNTYHPTINDDEQTYWLMVTDGNGCIDSSSIAIRAKEYPILSHRTNTGMDSVCVGGTIALYVSGAESYKWLADNSEENSYSETLNLPASFTVEGTTNGCTTPYVITIDTLQLPIFEIEAADEICLNDSLELKAGANQAKGGDLTYKWRHSGESKTTIKESPIATKTYYLTGTDQYGCKATFEHTVTVNELPADLTISGDNAVCKNEETTLTANAADAIRYDWYKDADKKTLLKENAENITVLIEKDSTFYVTATNSKTCQYTTSYKVTKIDHPTLDYTAPEYVCEGSKATISIKGATSYVWDIDNSQKSYRTDVITQDTSFTVTGTSNNCSTTLTVDIKKWDLPTITIDMTDVATGLDSSAICKGQGKLKLTGKGGIAGGYTWNTKEEKDFITVSPANDTKYSVTGTDKHGCQNTNEVTVIVHPLPIVTLTALDEVCAKDSFSLLAESTEDFVIKHYDWAAYDDNKDKNILETAITNDQTFHVTLTDQYGCYNSASHSVKAKPYPVLTLEAPEYVCDGSSAIVSVKGAATYKWLNSSVTQRSFVDVPTQDTTYVVEGTTNGCTTTDSIRVAVKPLPDITIESEGGADAICLNNSISLMAKNGMTYSWNTGATQNLITVSPLVTTTYNVTGKDANGCANDASFTVTVNDLPVFEIKGRDLVCEGDVDTLWIEGEKAVYTWTSHSNLTSDSLIYAINGSQTFIVRAVNDNKCASTQSKTVKTKAYPIVDIAAPAAVCDGSIATLTATGAASYEWENGSTNNSISQTITDDTQFTVRGTTSGCTTEKSVTVRKWDLPDVNITSMANEICFGQSVYMEASGANSYVWSNGSSTSGISVSPTTTTDFYVIGKSINNCESRDTFTITVHSLPVVNIEGDIAVCEGDKATLYAEGAKYYTWNTKETSDTIHPTITSTQLFSVIGEDEYGCVATTVKQVKKKDIPSLSYSAPSAVCLGKMATITVTGANSYKWEDGSTGNTLTPIPTERTTYKVTGISDGCERTIEVTIDTMNLPNVVISGDAEVCINNPITLVASGAKNYVWNTGQQTARISATPLSSISYVVTGTDARGCESIVTHDVTVNPLPSFHITGDLAVCEGNISRLTAESLDERSYTYTWNWKDENNASIARQTNSIDQLINKNTPFTIIAEDNKSCLAIQTITVESKAYPTISLIIPDKICEDEGVNITAYGANEYRWSNGSNTNQMADHPKGYGKFSYSVTGTINGCSTKKDVTVDVLERPRVSISGPYAVCEGSVLNLSASGAKFYEWDNGMSSSDIKVYPSITSKYTVKGTAENWCTDTATINVKVNPRPLFDILSEDNICAGQNLEMMASGDAKTYYWGYGDQGYEDNITFNNNKILVPIERNAYIFVKGIDDNGCVSEKFKEIRAITPPNIFYSGETDVCLGQSVRLTGQGGMDYVWKLDGKNYAGETFVFEPTKNTTLTLTGSLGLCSSTVNIDVTTKTTPEITIHGNTSVCKGSVASLSADGASTYLWSTGETTKSIQHELKNSMNYTVIGTAFNGCSATKSVTVFVNPLPHVRITGPDPKGCPEIGTTINFSAVGAEDYVWHSLTKDLGPNDDENPDIDGVTDDHIDATIFKETQISVIGTDAKGCVGYDTVVVSAKTFKPIQFQVSPGIIEDNNPTISLDGYYPETDKWHWETGDGAELDGKNTTYRYPNTYADSFLVNVSAIAKDGCEYKGNTYVYVWKDFWAPNAFTPNNDGLNDVFRFLGTEFMTDFHYIIYNRVGTVVFEGNSKDAEWDGTDMHGHKCPWGVYGYVVKFKSDFMSIHKSGEKRGTVTLER